MSVSTIRALPRRWGTTNKTPNLKYHEGKYRSRGALKTYFAREPYKGGA